MSVPVDRLGQHSEPPDGTLVIIGCGFDRMHAEALGELFHLPQSLDARRGRRGPVRHGLPRNSRPRRRPPRRSLDGGGQGLRRQGLEIEIRVPVLDPHSPDDLGTMLVKPEECRRVHDERARVVPPQDGLRLEFQLFSLAPRHADLNARRRLLHQLESGNALLLLFPCLQCGLRVDRFCREPERGQEQCRGHNPSDRWEL